ncbi:thylakoid ADP,ATP carrier protein, chloroplastic-like [Camellia sinensis]|uniref:thylakoid ADP,ATP carrier protein, chloroplastic-like n=1 Tax=Camellia sinensis TaxID=4442 RepID=UPI001036D970|nr:thylakoid ADP,ATP carrier protein, chloroplastic-like [Camellia sinensis]
MTSTFVSNIANEITSDLNFMGDYLLRLPVEPGYKTMSEVALNILREEEVGSFYTGLGPSLIAITPYIAVNFCKSLPEKYRKRTETSMVTALLSATLSTIMCFPLDTMRRQMQMKGTPYKIVLDAFSVMPELSLFLTQTSLFRSNCRMTIVDSSLSLDSSSLDSSSLYSCVSVIDP